ncbi:ArsC family reductase [Ningiella sp. W23]|uniref:ArsC family reductase n=1 Tax=Ningiella sp. W23 TaxID=3023715 RepID=UPI0037568F35
MLTMYGIANCDTVKRAKKWLKAHSIEYQFHDYKKASVDEAFLLDMIATHGVDTIVNKRGTTYRKLSDEQKSSLNAQSAVALLKDNTSMIKRPILITQNSSLVGFSEDAYAKALL